MCDPIILLKLAIPLVGAEGLAPMKLTVQLKLKPTPHQADALKRTLETANAACNYISQVAWESTTFRQFAIHRLTYQAVRETFGLSAQLTVRCIAKVADAYKLDRKTRRSFQPHGAIAYDSRILSFALSDSLVSIWTLDGRHAIPFVCGEHQRRILASQRGESDLVLIDGTWYLFATCEVETPALLDVEDALGVDLGVTNIAVDSDGETHSGTMIKNMRYRHRRMRTKLQKRRTLGSRRRLRQLAGQERRFAKHVNHCVSKRIIAKAECTKRAIVLEDLTHIRTRMKARRSQRATLHSWAFAQLRSFITYKAALKGIPVHFIDPRNTSRSCPACGHCAKENRKTQASFVCTLCGFAGPADVIAAGNIARRAAVNRPDCSEADSSVAPEQSRRL
jgi:IS605 OrfB family transposase